jgi:hypothetical protein
MMRSSRTVPTIYIVVAILLGCVSGCSRRVPVAIVVLVDPSASVTEQGRRDEFAVAARLIPGLQRGDSLTVVPITDNAVADIEGRVLRLRAPDLREPYDADLHRFRTQARQSYGAFTADLLAHPGMQTDILGALDVARQEFETIPERDQRILIVLSDFLEDDGRYRFVSDRRLASAQDARGFADCLRNWHGFSLHGVALRLGALQSNDFAQLDQGRQDAVHAFWPEYLRNSPALGTVQLDGSSVLAWNRE